MTTHVRSFALLLFAVAGCSGTEPAMQGLAIGSPCTSSMTCGSGAPYFCDKSHPNGYCKADCNVDADCPVEAICAHDGAVGECHRRCDALGDCRSAEGYVCKPASTDPKMLASHGYCDIPDVTTDGGSDTISAG